MIMMVVLSSCYSGCGDINYAVGLIGMRTALMATDARAIIVNLWEVDDLASAVFMTKFYSLITEFTVSDAFQKSKQYLMNVTVEEEMVFGPRYQLKKS